MSIAEIKQEIQSMPSKEQDALAAYLTVVRLSRNPDFREELRELKNEKASESWLSLDELKAKLS